VLVDELPAAIDKIPRSTAVLLDELPAALDELPAAFEHLANPLLPALDDLLDALNGLLDDAPLGTSSQAGLKLGHVGIIRASLHLLLKG